MTFRRRVELLLGPLVVVASRLPRVVPFLVVIALLLGGLLLSGPLSAALLLVLAAVLGGLVFLGWPTLDTQARALRLAVVTLIAVDAVTRL